MSNEAEVEYTGGKRVWRISWWSIFGSAMAFMSGLLIPVVIAITWLYWVGAGGLQ